MTHYENDITRDSCGNWAYTDVMDHPPNHLLPPGCVWVWMSGAKEPHWEPRGTGLVTESAGEVKARVREV